MAVPMDYPSPEYNLEDWEKALTLTLGTAYACRDCGTVVMVTRSGVGTMEHTCCGKPMQVVEPGEQPKEAGR